MLQYCKLIFIQIIIVSISSFCNEILALDFLNSLNIVDQTSLNQFNGTDNNYREVFEISKYRNKDVFEDSFLSTCELVMKYGYPCEKHTVETEDGYLLEMHRIPKPGARPVLLMHGLLDSSSTWVIMGPGKGLGYLLSDLGYDVWMGNVRGNTYSKKHKTLSTKSAKFWNFSFNEMGRYDMPAIIDYVLDKSSGFKKIHYIGHSQGTMIFWILCHYRPEYNEKILSMQGLGLAAFLSHCKSPIVLSMASMQNSFQELTKLLGINEFFPNLHFVRLFAQEFCRNGAITQPICENIIFVMAGYNEAKMNKTMLPVITSHCPAGASVRQIVHFLQLVKSGHFRAYDFGLMANLRKYGQTEPPDYDLSRVKTKVAAHYAENDWLSTPTDVKNLLSKLPNLIDAHLIADKNYNHLDYLWAIDAKEMVYDKVFDILHKVENGKL